MFKRLIALFQRKLIISVLKYQKWRRKDEAVSLFDGWNDVRCCLICLPPDSVEEEEVGVVLDRLRQRFPQAKIVVGVLAGRDISFSDDSIEIIRIDEAMLSPSGMPKSSVREQLKAISADISIDLSPTFVPLSAYLCMLSGARIKIGFAGLSHGDLVFNFQIAPKAERTGIERYQVLAGYIG